MYTLTDQLREWVCTLSEDTPYFRPFVCYGHEVSFDIFIVGINPATPIDKNDMEMEQYISLLTRKDDFYKEYQKIRERKGKTKTSRTRKGIANLVDELERSTGKAVLETNVIPFPTTNVKELKTVDQAVIGHAKRIFYQVLLEFSPSVIIVHSKTSLKHLIEVLSKNEVIGLDDVDISQPIKVIEKDAPLFQFHYPSGRIGTVFVCHHLMYFGEHGNSFAALKKGVVNYFDKIGN